MQSFMESFSKKLIDFCPVYEWVRILSKLEILFILCTDQMFGPAELLCRTFTVRFGSNDKVL